MTIQLVMPVFPLPNLLMGLLAIRLGYQNTIAKSLVTPQAEEGANVRYANFTILRRLFLLLLLTGCASVPSTLQPVVRPAEAEQKPFVLNGRISVKHDGDRSSANIRWTHRVEDDDILLLAPLGQTMAHIHSDAQKAILDTADKHYTAQDTEELTQQVLGWHLPLAGLRYWVLALPAPASQATIERDANGQASLMRQDGWEIRYTRYAAPSADSLPLRMSLQREGMELQLLIDEWEIK